MQVLSRIIHRFPAGFRIIPYEFRDRRGPAVSFVTAVTRIKILSMRKWTVILVFYFLQSSAVGQNVQLHYDFRHSIDPNLNPENFPSISFEYFKLIDTVGTGSFLVKAQADLKGRSQNIGQVFLQLSQSLRFWKPKLYLYLNYSGGLGVTKSSAGFYIANSYGLGISYPFQWKGAWLATNLSLRYNAFKKPSYDPQFTFYFGRGIRRYKFFTAGSFVFWTENRDQGETYTRDRKGKKLAFFGDPQIWLNLTKGFSVGTRVNVFYHTLTEDDAIQFYPTAGVKYQF